MHNQDYLCHYGVPGMRWGRRMRYKEARKEYDRLYDEEYKVENKAAKALEAKMLSYANKHKLAYDDGGGGTDKQRRKYEEMSEKQMILEDQANRLARQKAGKKFVEKYGEKDFKHMKRVDNAKAAVALTAFLAIPVITIGGISSLLIRK